MKKLLLASLIAFGISCSKEQLNNNKLSGDWYVSDIKVGEGWAYEYSDGVMAFDKSSDTVFFHFDNSDVATSATMEGSISCSDSANGFKYQFVGNAMVVNNVYPKGKYNIEASRNRAVIKSQNGDYFILRK